MPSDPALYPYDTIVFVTSTMGGRTVQGSGVLISPDEVLTASHVVYSSTYGAASHAILERSTDVAEGAEREGERHGEPAPRGEHESGAEQRANDGFGARLAALW